MPGPRLIPTGPEVIRSTLVVLASAVLAALVMSQAPGLRDWIARAWGDRPPTHL